MENEQNAGIGAATTTIAQPTLWSNQASFMLYRSLSMLARSTDRPPARPPARTSFNTRLFISAEKKKSITTMGCLIKHKELKVIAYGL